MSAEIYNALVDELAAAGWQAALDAVIPTHDAGQPTGSAYFRFWARNERGYAVACSEWCDDLHEAVGEFVRKLSQHPHPTAREIFAGLPG